MHMNNSMSKQKTACVSAHNTYNYRSETQRGAIWKKIHSSSSAIFRHCQYKHLRLGQNGIKTKMKEGFCIINQLCHVHTILLLKFML